MANEIVRVCLRNVHAKILVEQDVSVTQLKILLKKWITYAES